MSSNLVEKLTSTPEGEQATFLNDIVKFLWPNIAAATSQMTKEIAEPMFKSMLPGPLSSLHFTKLDLGKVPFRFHDVVVTQTETQGIKLDMNVDWDGELDVMLDANMMPELGVKHVKLRGRLSVLLAPLTNVIPLIGAAQISFINPPSLHLDFTGAANVADFDLIDGTVRSTLLSIINSMATLPNRYLLTLSSTNDYFATHLPPLGVLRLRVEKAWEFAEEAQGKARKLLSKITRAAPDCYVKASLGAEEPWQTATRDNTVHPSWNETKDFVVSDFAQCVKLELFDKDVNGDDELGVAFASVKDLLLQPEGRMELSLLDDEGGSETGGKIAISSEYFPLETSSEASKKSLSHPSPSSLMHSENSNHLSGIASVLIASASNLQGLRDKLQPSVKVSWTGSGSSPGTVQEFRTAVKSDAPGTDIANPSFDQGFRFPLTGDMAGSSGGFHIALLDGEQEVGGVDVSFKDVLNAEGMVVREKFEVGAGGASVRAAVSLMGLGEKHQVQQETLPRR